MMKKDIKPKLEDRRSSKHTFFQNLEDSIGDFIADFIADFMVNLMLFR